MTRDIAARRLVYHSSAANESNTGHLVTDPVAMSWISGGEGAEWLMIDLGAPSRIHSVSVLWGAEYAAAYTIEVSADGNAWTEAAHCQGGRAECVRAELKQPEAEGTWCYVRLLFEACSGDHYVIDRVFVEGENALQYVLPPQPAPDADGTQKLTGGSWRVERASLVEADGTVLSGKDYDDASWLPAVVPGTVLTSYIQADAVPDPFYDEDQFQNSEEYFTANFWYRNHFIIPLEKEGGRVFLNFQSVNWKADVYLNGRLLENTLPGRTHSIEGAFIRAKFDITDLAVFGGENDLAVKIYKNATPGLVTSQGLAFGPGPNGGLLGADNPTLHAAVGWDWLPTMRGRDIGIIGDVTLTYGGDVELLDPWMETDLPLISESSGIPMEDLTLREEVLLDGKPGRIREWDGRNGDGFVLDFGSPIPIGTVTLVWGTEAGGAAADLESRHPEVFRLEVSEDGETYEPLDACQEGTAELPFLGLSPVLGNPGSEAYEGHAISDTLPGATGTVQVDLTRFGRGIMTRELVRPAKKRYLRFTVLRQRELNGKAVDAIVREIRVYQETPEQVEQGTRHTYELDTTKAELTFRTEIRNDGPAAKQVRLEGRILEAPADCFSGQRSEETGTPCLTFAGDYTADPGKVLAVQLPLTLQNPKLWWPNTYGEQNLYTAEITVLADGRVSDRKVFRFGVRRFDYPIEGGMLTLYCNGTRIVCKGGNWGIDDGLKLDDTQALFDKVRLHAEANMTMIRNWVGMTSHPAFYDACDTYGVLIWDDFWLANPVDGPEPDDPEMFLQNAADKVRAVRPHPSLVFYCGRNEGNPREDIDEGLRTCTEELDGTRVYFPNSAALPVGSGGGYSLARPGHAYGVKQYFNDVTSAVLRSERGIPNVPELESVKKFLRPEHLWPISEAWALHDWTYHMNGPANTYMEALKNYLGGEFTVPVDHVQGQAPTEEDPVFRAYKADIARMCQEAAEAWTVEEFFQAAQLINYDHHRGMFDALSAGLSNGLLMWMSQSSWPSFMWQTYDYYLYTNGGFFGCRAGNQPTRALFDPREDRILLANATPNRYEHVTVTEYLYDLTGTCVHEEAYPVEALETDAYGVLVGTVDFTASGTDLVFLRLVLQDAEGHVLGENRYWHNRSDYQNYQALRDIPKTEVQVKMLEKTELTAKGTGQPMTKLVLEVQNGPAPALNTRVRLLGRDGGDLLPVFFSDNYLLMMPGERRTITAEFATEKLLGDGPAIDVTWWNQDH